MVELGWGQRGWEVGPEHGDVQHRGDTEMLAVCPRGRVCDGEAQRTKEVRGEGSTAGLLRAPAHPSSPAQSRPCAAQRRGTRRGRASALFEATLGPSQPWSSLSPAPEGRSPARPHRPAAVCSSWGCAVLLCQPPPCPLPCVFGCKIGPGALQPPVPSVLRKGRDEASAPGLWDPPGSRSSMSPDRPP